MKSKKVLLIFVFAVILLLVIPCSKTMASPSNKKQQADQNIANFKKEIQKLDGQSFEILAKISQVEANILSNKAKIEELEAELVQKQEELNLATQKYDKQKNEYYDHLRNKYEEGEINFIEIILSSSNITDFINYNEYYRIVKEQEEIEVRKIKDSKSAVEAKKISIEENKKTAEEKINSLAVEKGKLDVIKYTYDNTKVKLEKQLAAEEAARQQIIQEMNSLINTYSSSYRVNYTGSGILQWPVPSVSPSTLNVQPYHSGHKGFDIGGMTDTTRAVVAADSGVVILAQWYYGYGNAVIVNHGNGMVTLYGHLNSINVSPRQAVSRGQKIGIMGNTGDSFGIHLHFELIINGANVNPEPYIR